MRNAWTLDTYFICKLGWCQLFVFQYFPYAFFHYSDDIQMYKDKLYFIFTYVTYMYPFVTFIILSDRCPWYPFPVFISAGFKIISYGLKKIRITGLVYSYSIRVKVIDNHVKGYYILKILHSILFWCYIWSKMII